MRDYHLHIFIEKTKSKIKRNAECLSSNATITKPVLRVCLIIARRLLRQVLSSFGIHRIARLFHHTRTIYNFAETFICKILNELFGFPVRSSIRLVIIEKMSSYLNNVNVIHINANWNSRPVWYINIDYSINEYLIIWHNVTYERINCQQEWER